MDQRKVNMLAREYCDDCRPKRLKPVVLSHAMLPGLLEVRLRLWADWHLVDILLVVHGCAGVCNCST